MIQNTQQIHNNEQGDTFQSLFNRYAQQSSPIDSRGYDDDGGGLKCPLIDSSLERKILEVQHQQQQQQQQQKKTS